MRFVPYRGDINAFRDDLHASAKLGVGLAGESIAHAK
jgi:hypothetical protein